MSYIKDTYVIGGCDMERYKWDSLFASVMASYKEARTLADKTGDEWMEGRADALRHIIDLMNA